MNIQIKKRVNVRFGKVEVQDMLIERMRSSGLKVPDDPEIIYGEDHSIFFNYEHEQHSLGTGTHAED